MKHESCACFFACLLTYRYLFVACLLALGACFMLACLLASLLACLVPVFLYSCPVCFPVCKKSHRHKGTFTCTPHTIWWAPRRGGLGTGDLEAGHGARDAEVAFFVKLVITVINHGCPLCPPPRVPAPPGVFLPAPPGVFLPVQRHRGEPGHTRDRHKNLTNQPQNQPQPPTFYR